MATLSAGVNGLSPAAARNLIHIANLEKRYAVRDGVVHALHSVSFAVTPGEFVSVVGPSGCGKSTLLKILGGLIPRSGGEVWLAGTEVTGPRKDVGIVFQQPVLLPWRTVLDNVMLPVDVQRLDKQVYRRRALDLIALVGLVGFERRYPNELSGGMQQRVAISRALVHDPSILMMDEPFGALDAMTREYMNVELLKIWHESGKTVLFITHSIPEAVFLSDRVVVMSPRPGTILDIVPVDLPRPRSLDVMNTEPFGRLVKHIRSYFNMAVAL